MKYLFSITLFFLYSLPLLSQSKLTILDHLQNGETLRLEWIHQQYLPEGGSVPSNYPLFPDQMKDGEGEGHIGLKLEMERCGEKSCPVKIWIEYVSSVQFPKRQNFKASLDIFSATTPENALHFPKIEDTRYVLKKGQVTPFSLGKMKTLPILVDVEKGLLESSWAALNIAENTLPAAFNFYYFQQFLASIWSQEWTQKEYYKVVKKQEQFDKLSVHFFKPVLSPKSTIITGKVLSPAENNVKIMGLKEGSWIETGRWDELLLDTNDRFQIEVDLDNPALFSLVHGFNMLMLYVEPGDSLHIEIDANAFYRKTHFMGNQTISNQFLLDFYHQIRGDIVFGSLDQNLLQKSQLEYLEENKSKEKRDLDYLINYPQPLNLTFFHKVERNIRFGYARELWYNARFFYKNRDAKLESEYIIYGQQLRKYFFRLPEHKIHDFFLEGYLDFQKILLKGRYIYQPFPARTAQDFELAKMLFSPKNAFRIGRFLLSFSQESPNSKNIANIYDEIRQICLDPIELKSLEDYKNPDFKLSPLSGWRTLAIGKNAPHWVFQNQGKGTFSLSDFKGTHILLHIGLEENLEQALSDLAEIKKNSPTDLQILSIVRHRDGIMESMNQKEVYYITPKEMLSLRSSYRIDNDANHYYLINPEGKILSTPFFTSSFHKLKSIIEDLPTEEQKKGWELSNRFWRNIGLAAFFLLLLSGIYIQRKRLLAKKEQRHRQLVELELKGIRAQMNPHFLFNALSSIQNLIRKKDEVGADRYLTQFAGLVRKILQNSEQEFITLDEEMAAIKQYCSLEALRTTFEYEIKVAEDIDVFNTYIPGMLLQPLIENAILHGLMPQQGKRNLWIMIQPHPDGLACEIIDNGIGINNAKIQKQTHRTHQKSFGLSLVKQRLQLLSNLSDKELVSITDRSELDSNTKGTIVKLIIPIEK